MELLYKDITDKIIKSFYKVYNELGFGFLEKVYRNALYLELVGLGFYCEKTKIGVNQFNLIHPCSNGILSITPRHIIYR